MKILKKIRNRVRKLKFKWYLHRIEKGVFEDLLNLRLNYLVKSDTDLSIDMIVLSKDRAMQLHALLATKELFSSNCDTVSVLYTTSSSEHEKSYKTLKEMLPDVTFVKEASFNSDLNRVLSTSKSSKSVFLCDDQFFKESVDFHEIAGFNPYLFCFSLNRGKDTTRNIGMVQKLPDFLPDVIYDKKVLCWKWEDCKESPDWAYPLSVGGVVFSRLEILGLLKMIDFRGPNSLEGYLQNFIRVFAPRYGLCYEKAILGSIPANIVSSESNCKTLNTFTTDELLAKWNDGYRIKYEDYFHRNWDDLLHEKFNFVKR